MVRDPNGHIRASLGANGGKVGLDLWDPEGHRRATLGLGSEGAPHLAFYDRDQRVRAELNLGPDGEPKFTLRDKRSLQGKRSRTLPAIPAISSLREEPVSAPRKALWPVPRPARQKPFPPTGTLRRKSSSWAPKPPTSTIIPPASGSERDNPSELDKI